MLVTVDIQKAFDSVYQQFLTLALRELWILQKIH